MSRRAQHSNKSLAYSLIVVYYKDACCVGGLSILLLDAGIDSIGVRQADCEGRPVSQAADDFDPAPVALDDAVTNRKPETRPLSSLGGEERLEDAIACLAAHADSIIGEAHVHEAVPLFGSHRQTAALRHGVKRVEDDVHEDFAEFGS